MTMVYEGALQYPTATDMGLDELNLLFEQAVEINTERQKANNG